MGHTFSTAEPLLKDEALLIHSKLEIQQILRTIKKAQVLLHLAPDDSDHGFVTTILDIDPAQGIFTVDCSPKEDINKRLQTSPQNHLQTYLDRILISFTTTAATPCLHDKKPALQLPIPASIHRLQRRRYFRVSVPVSNPAIATLNINDKSWSFPLVDINVGGMALSDDSLSIDAKAGILVRDASLYLPGVGSLQLDLLFVRSQDDTLPTGRTLRRIGCTFLNLPGTAEMTIQSYISQLERQDIARRRGLL